MTHGRLSSGRYRAGGAGAAEQFQGQCPQSESAFTQEMAVRGKTCELLLIVMRVI